MINLPDEVLDQLEAGLSQLHRQVQAVRGLFRFQIGRAEFEMPVEHWNWQPVPGVEGAEICALPPEYWPDNAPPHTDYFGARGKQGTRPDQPVRLRQAVRVEIIKGHIDYKKASWPGYVEHVPGDVFEVEPEEPHSFLAKTDYRCRVAFTPRITQP